MTQSGVSAFTRLARRFAVSAVVLLGSAGALSAQTGKIEGKVRDQAGAPIQNAQVVIVGTAFSALTNAQGYYFINNIPAGTMILRPRSSVTSVRGRRRQGAHGPDDHPGHPVGEDHRQLEEVVVGADNPLVPRDEVTTKQRIDGEFTENLPVDRVSQVLQLQPGVVAENNGTQLSIRGGRTDEAAFYVDGVTTQPGNRGTGFVSAGTNASNGANARLQPEQHRRDLWHQRLRRSLGDHGRRQRAVRQRAVGHREPHDPHWWQQVRGTPRGGDGRGVRQDAGHGLQPLRGQPQRSARPQGPDVQHQPAPARATSRSGRARTGRTPRSSSAAAYRHDGVEPGW